MPIHIQTGYQNSVAIVFSCPGRHEELAGYPAAKTTGKNLEQLLLLLSEALNRSDLTRRNITITNAWPDVEYEAKTGRSEATEQDVMRPKNLERLQRELSNITEFVIFCGDIAKATSLKLLLNRNPKFIYVNHLATRGLLSIEKDVHGQLIVVAKCQLAAGRKISKQKIEAENTGKRLAVVACSVLKQLLPPEL